jgi:UDP-3-O-[3-hydroxymyristoyl] glucosamine N-acyltransferase
VCIEDEVTIWGQVGTTSGITIGESSYSWSNRVTKSVEGGKRILELQLKNREKIETTSNIKNTNFK